METDKRGWADDPGNRQRVRWVLYGACAGLVIVDFVIHRHISTAVEEIPAFYALYGFAALVGVVLAAKGLRRLVKRDESYYEQ